MILKNEMHESNLAMLQNHRPVFFRIGNHLSFDIEIILGLIFSIIKDTESRLKIYSS